MQKRSAHSRKLTIAGFVLLAVIGAFALVRLNADGDARPLGETAQQRIDYIRSFGWEVGIAPSSVKDIRIPADFDEAYEQYNAIQREQGFDLRKYRACFAKKYTYDILNYPEPSPIAICANLIVCDGKIIGADISSAEANGLVTVLAKK